MSRITKTISETTAGELVKEKNIQLGKKEKEFEDKITQLISKKIPDDVLKFHKKYPKYIRTSSSVTANGNGWDFQRLHLNKSLPSPNGNTFQYTPELEISKELLAEFNAINDTKNEISKLRIDLERVIFNLRTYKAVQENFPEAFEKLPNIVNNAVQLNLSDIRNRIK